MRASRRTTAGVGVCLLILAVAVAAPGPTTAEAENGPVSRVAGTTRFATAGELGTRVPGDTLWLATGLVFADALSASAAGTGPVLLAAGDHAPAATLDAARELQGIERVRAVGGRQALGAEVVASVAQAAGVDDVQRLAGPTRFGTAAAVSRARHPGGSEVAYVATGLAFADALTASVPAADADAPVLLTAGDALPAATRTELERLDPAKVVIVGGTEAVSPAVADALADHAEAVTRVGGPDRFATAAAVSAHRGLSQPDEALLATGETFADVLTAAPAAAAADAPLLLSAAEYLPAVTGQRLEGLGVGQLTVVGGHAAVSPSVVETVTDRLGALETPDSDDSRPDGDRDRAEGPGGDDGADREDSDGAGGDEGRGDQGRGDERDDGFDGGAGDGQLPARSGELEAGGLMALGGGSALGFDPDTSLAEQPVTIEASWSDAADVARSPLERSHIADAGRVLELHTPETDTVLASDDNDAVQVVLSVPDHLDGSRLYPLRWTYAEFVSQRGGGDPDVSAAWEPTVGVYDPDADLFAITTPAIGGSEFPTRLVLTEHRSRQTAFIDDGLAARLRQRYPERRELFPPASASATRPPRARAQQQSGGQGSLFRVECFLVYKDCADYQQQIKGMESHLQTAYETYRKELNHGEAGPAIELIPDPYHASPALGDAKYVYRLHGDSDPLCEGASGYHEFVSNMTVTCISVMPAYEGTTAHELFHSFQDGINLGNELSDAGFIREGTATLAEDLDNIDSIDGGAEPLIGVHPQIKEGGQRYKMKHFFHWVLHANHPEGADVEFAQLGDLFARGFSVSALEEWLTLNTAWSDLGSAYAAGIRDMIIEKKVNYDGYPASSARKCKLDNFVYDRMRGRKRKFSRRDLGTWRKFPTTVTPDTGSVRSGPVKAFTSGGLRDILHAPERVVLPLTTQVIEIPLEAGQYRPLQVTAEIDPGPDAEDVIEGKFYNSAEAGTEACHDSDGRQKTTISVPPGGSTTVYAFISNTEVKSWDDTELLLGTVRLPWTYEVSVERDVHFEDEDLERVVRDKAGLADDEDIEREDVEDITQLDATGPDIDIETLRGIHHLVSLERLDLSGNSLGSKTFDWLRPLSELRQLDVAGNDLAGLDGLAALDGLQRVDLRANRKLDTRSGSSATSVIHELQDRGVEVRWDREFELAIETEGDGDVTQLSQALVRGSLEGREAILTYQEGMDLRVRAEPSDAWRFDHWSGALSGTGDLGELSPVDADNASDAGVLTVRAHFTKGSGDGGTRPIKLIKETSTTVHQVSPPSSLQQHDSEDTKVQLIREPGALLSQEPLALNARKPGRYDISDDLTPDPVPVGRRVESVLLHFDPPGSGFNLTSISGSVTFTRDVLGIIMLREDLAASNDPLGYDHVTYSDQSGMNKRDSIRLHPDRRQVSFDFTARPGADEARVIFRSGDTPGKPEPQ